MTTLFAKYNPTTRVVVLDESNAALAGSTDIGSFEHPDPVYPGSVVAYHGVRDLLYKCSAANPANTAMFPDNITDMAAITIDMDLVIPPNPPVVSFVDGEDDFTLAFTPALATLNGVSYTMTVNDSPLEDGTLTVNGFSVPYPPENGTYTFTLKIVGQNDVVYQTTIDN